MIEQLRLNQTILSIAQGKTGRDVQALRTAHDLFQKAQFCAQLAKLWSALARRPRRLLYLESVRCAACLRGSHYAGLYAVPIRQIRGSEGRCEDFDSNFMPLKLHNRGRWASVATAWLMATPLPPVELIQVGDVYFVRDGHHRISVARMMGQDSIDAEVTVWETAGPLPWERAATVQMALQPAQG